MIPDCYFSQETIYEIYSRIDDVGVSGSAGNGAVTIAPDSVGLVTDSASLVPVKKSFVRKVLDYFSLDGGGDAQSTSTFSVLGGPHFDSVSGLALSIVGAASMRLNGCDSLSQLSNAQLSATYTTKNFWDLNFAGNILFPNNMRLITKVTFEYQPLYFWGMGYENGNNSDNKTMQKKYLANIDAELLFSIADNLRFGPILQWDYVNSDTIARPELLQGQHLVLRNYGAGCALEYDTRDMVTDAKTGAYLYVAQTFSEIPVESLRILNHRRKGKLLPSAVARLHACHRLLGTV